LSSSVIVLGDEEEAGAGNPTALLTDHERCFGLVATAILLAETLLSAAIVRYLLTGAGAGASSLSSSVIVLGDEEEAGAGRGRGEAARLELDGGGTEQSDGALDRSRTLLRARRDRHPPRRNSPLGSHSLG
jgi:hypothetical protein